MIHVRRDASHWLTRLACGGLVLAAVLCGLKRQGKTSSKNAEQKPARGQQPAKPKPPGHSYSHYDHPTEEEHRTAEQFSWRHSFALNVGIAVVVAITFLVSLGTYVETKRQADLAQGALIQSQRAWVDVKIDETKVSLTWQGDVPDIKLTTTAVNDGNSLATTIEFGAKLFFTADGPVLAQRDDMRAACGITIPALGPLGQTAFMKENIVVDEKLGINTPATRAWLKLIRIGNPVQKVILPLVILACANYRIGQDSDTHYTVHVYNVQIVTPDGLFPPVVGHDLPVGQVIVHRYFDGEYAD